MKKDALIQLVAKAERGLSLDIAMVLATECCDIETDETGAEGRNTLQSGFFCSLRYKVARDMPSSFAALTMLLPVPASTAMI